MSKRDMHDDTYLGDGAYAGGGGGDLFIYTERREGIPAASYSVPGSGHRVVDATQYWLNSPEYAEQQRQKAEQEAEERRQGQVDDAVLKIMDAEPPSAEELGVDVAGLGPKRARLVRYCAWR